MINFNVLVPNFLNKDYCIKDFNAQEGGIISCTNEIQQAIDTCHKNGGGRVVFPKGIWLSGPIEIKSNVNLYFERQSLLIFTKSKEEYPVIITDWEGEERIRTVSPITAKNASNIAITGSGIIDGSGHLWRPIKQFKLTAKFWKAKLQINDSVIETKEGGIWYPTKTAYEGCLNGEVRPDEENCLDKAAPYYDLYRPVLVNFVNCDKVLIDGVTLQNSPAWNVHPLYCTNFTLSNATIRNHYSAQNGDGLDLESCQNCEIKNTVFDVGDDGICLKSGKGEKARQTKIPTKNVYIHDCTVYEAHGGFVVGSENSRGLENIIVENCSFIGTDIGIRFKSALGRGGVIENIKISNIRMQDIKEEAIIFTMGYQLFALDHEKQDVADNVKADDIPEMKNIFLDNIICNGAKIALKINGLKQLPIHDITLSNSYLSCNELYNLSLCENIKLVNTTLVNANTNEKIIFKNEIFNGEKND